MFEKIKNLQNHPFTKQLNDLRAWGLIVFGVIVLMVTWSGIKAVQANYNLQRQISRLQQENQVQQLENNNLRLKNQYFNTDQYLELAARQEFGKVAEGEKVLLVPRNVALAHTVDLPSLNKQIKQQPTLGNRPTYQKNFQAWIDFFLHRPTVSN